MTQYMRIFGKKEDDYVRYWASISTEKTKDGKGTGKFARANMTVSMSKSAERFFDDHCEKTKTKGIKQLNVEAVDFWLKAREPKDTDAFVYIFINEMRIPKKDDEEEDE